MTSYTICTAVSRRKLPSARVLGRSVEQSARDATFVVLILDGQPNDDEESFTTVSLSDVGLGGPLGREMCGIYAEIELEQAVRPWLIEFCLARAALPVISLDADCEVFGSLESFVRSAPQDGVAVIPYIRQPIPNDGLLPDEETLLRWGTYDAGCVAIGAESAGGPFLEFWKQHCQRRVNPLDSRWLNLVHLFPHSVNDDPAYDVGYWNAWERELTRQKDQILAGGRPLRLLQFKGFDPERSELLTTEQQAGARVILSEHPVLAELSGARAAALLRAQYERHTALPYGWASSACGTELDPATRATYLAGLNRLDSSDARLPGPFDDDGGLGFAAWLSSLSGSTNVPPYLSLLCDSYPDLTSAFPDHRTVYRSAAGLCEWIHNRNDIRAITARDLLGESSVFSLLDVPTEIPVVAAPRTTGINVIGYHHAEDGIGEAGRLVAAAAAGAGIPCIGYSLRATPSSLAHRPGFPIGTQFEGETNVFCVGMDLLEPTMEAIPPTAGRGRRSVSVWFWETDAIPERHLAAFDLVDEVWAGSSFTKQALDRSGRGPVKVIPLPVVVPHARPSQSRRELGLPDGFLVFSMFSWLSVLERKNPQGVIDAFTRAFDPEDGAHLVIKSHGEVRGDARSERLRLRSSRPDIHFVDGHVRQSEVWAMFDACDCYISLHRSEGFGLTMAEAMAAGRPVIATAWSGNLDFMDEQTSYLVPAAVTAIPGDVPVYGGLGRWAEPDVEAAAAALRRVHDDPTGAQAVGRRARSHIERTRSTQASGAVLAKYLEDLHARAR